MRNTKLTVVRLLAIFCVSQFAFVTAGLSQEVPPAPGAPKSVKVPAVQEAKLANGLTVAVIEKNAVPLVTINLLVRAGASSEPSKKAGLANLTAAMLTKGTKTRSATEIAEAVEFLGGSIESGAGWNSSFVSITVTSDKVDQAMAILSDVILNPKFEESELDLLKSQTLDGLKFNLKQPSSLANYVASKYSFSEHPAGGTPESVESIKKADIDHFYSKNYRSDMSVIIYAGNISITKATSIAKLSFNSMEKWQGTPGTRAEPVGLPMRFGPSEDVRRVLVVDLPKSGQASVGYYKSNSGVGRRDPLFYPASVMNSVFGGGYSSRLNLEIRIKRGLSYGAGSSFAWRSNAMNFSTRAQTKNESAAEVAGLVISELKTVANSLVANDELVPRKSVLTGGFGRNLETTGGLAAALADLYSFRIPTSALNSYVSEVNGVTTEQIKDFATKALLGGDIIIVGDYSIFKENLAKRFPGMKIEVIQADELDLSKENLRK